MAPQARRIPESHDWNSYSSAQHSGLQCQTCLECSRHPVSTGNVPVLFRQHLSQLEDLVLSVPQVLGQSGDG